MRYKRGVVAVLVATVLVIILRVAVVRNILATVEPVEVLRVAVILGILVVAVVIGASLGYMVVAILVSLAAAIGDVASSVGAIFV